MSNGSKAKEEPRNPIEKWFASTVAPKRQPQLGQRMDLRLAKVLVEGVTRNANAETYGREFKRHETEPIN